MSEPVRVELSVEGFGRREEHTIEIDRDEWNNLTPAQRVKQLEEQAEAFATNYVGWGWNIADESDYAAAGTGEGQPA